MRMVRTVTLIAVTRMKFARTLHRPRRDSPLHVTNTSLTLVALEFSRATTMVSEIVLLQGSWYALEQAGRLLRASVVVFNADDSATALALAMFGREELGRSRILRDIAAEVAAGRSFSPKEVANRCDDHVRKQRAGLLSTTLRVNPPSALADALRTTVSSSPRADQWTSSRNIIKAASAAKMKRDPHVRHGKRENALYVDLDHSGTSWSRPCSIPASAAREEIEDAVGDYAIECDALRDDVIENDFPKMAKARAAMNPAPILLEATWPTLMEATD